MEFSSKSHTHKAGLRENSTLGKLEFCHPSQCCPLPPKSVALLLAEVGGQGCRAQSNGEVEWHGAATGTAHPGFSWAVAGGAGQAGLGTTPPAWGAGNALLWAWAAHLCVSWGNPWPWCSGQSLISSTPKAGSIQTHRSHIQSLHFYWENLHLPGRN